MTKYKEYFIKSTLSLIVLIILIVIHLKNNIKNVEFQYKLSSATQKNISLKESLAEKKLIFNSITNHEYLEKTSRITFDMEQPTENQIIRIKQEKNRF